MTALGLLTDFPSAAETLIEASDVYRDMPEHRKAHYREKYLAARYDRLRAENARLARELEDARREVAGC